MKGNAVRVWGSNFHIVRNAKGDFVLDLRFAQCHGISTIEGAGSRSPTPDSATCILMDGSAR